MTEASHSAKIAEKQVETFSERVKAIRRSLHHVVVGLGSLMGATGGVRRLGWGVGPAAAEWVDVIGNPLIESQMFSREGSATTRAQLASALVSLRSPRG